MELLEGAGAIVAYSDPLVGEIVLPSGPKKSEPIPSARLGEFDLVAVLQPSPAWPRDELVACGVPLFDAVNALGPPERPGHERL
jgi:hypothetical protein